jgi:hypothetical protein
MKTIIPLTALAALVASSTIHAQTPAYSKPSGYVTQSLTANSFNLVGLTLQNSPVASGNFETVTETTLTDTGATFTPVASRTYVLEIITSPATPSLVGSIFEIPAANISGNTITVTTVPQINLNSIGLTSTATYNLRLAPNLEEIFRTHATSMLTRGLSSGNADIVWVPTNTVGVYNQYFVHSTTNAFRIAGTTTPAPNIPVIYADGLLIQKKAAATTFTQTGQVKTVGTNNVIASGINPVSMVAPAGLTLMTAGFETSTGWVKGLSAGNSDVVWIPSGVNTYDQYYFHSSTSKWRNVATNTAIGEDIPLPSAILVQKKTGTLSLSLKVPTSYNSL